MKNSLNTVQVIGGGLAGVEAAYHLANQGILVNLYEMRPGTQTPAHKTEHLAELVCSNSFKGLDTSTAHGLLKKEMQELNSIIINVAFSSRIPAGKALAVDRNEFAQQITQTITSHPNIHVIREEVTEFSTNNPTIIATGPLTSDPLALTLSRISGGKRLFFYDAISPIIDAISINMNKAFFGSRWEPDSTDYLNCSLDKDLYYAFVDELLSARQVYPREFEEARYFEGCLPVEVIADRGKESLRFGAMRPIGLVEPATQKKPYAVLQLRKENLNGEAYNMVGFQTRLTYPEQKRIFGMIPALEKAHFFRYGSIHRNTFIDSPRLIEKDLSIRGHRNLVIAGQILGVEGYMESAAMGIIAAFSILALLKQKPFLPPGPDTAIGALISYITDARIDKFQPMNINFGIMPAPQAPKKEKRQRLLETERSSFQLWLKSLEQLR